MLGKFPHLLKRTVTIAPRPPWLLAEGITGWTAAARARHRGSQRRGNARTDLAAIIRAPKQCIEAGWYGNLGETLMHFDQGNPLAFRCAGREALPKLRNATAKAVREYVNRSGREPVWSSGAGWRRDCQSCQTDPDRQCELLHRALACDIHPPTSICCIFAPSSRQIDCMRRNSNDQMISVDKGRFTSGGPYRINRCLATRAES